MTTIVLRWLPGVRPSTKYICQEYGHAFLCTPVSNFTQLVHQMMRGVAERTSFLAITGARRSLLVPLTTYLIYKKKNTMVNSVRIAGYYSPYRSMFYASAIS